MAKQKYVFGELEQAIMDIVWKHREVTVRDVLEHLRQRGTAYTTDMTVMNRLVAQRVLVRQQAGVGAFTYRARISFEQFSAEASRSAVDDLVRRYGAVAMAQFIDCLDRVPSEKVEELRRKLHREKQ